MRRRGPQQLAETVDVISGAVQEGGELIFDIDQRGRAERRDRRHILGAAPTRHALHWVDDVIDAAKF